MLTIKTIVKADNYSIKENSTLEQAVSAMNKTAEE
jgi:hypothetical protein